MEAVANGMIELRGQGERFRLMEQSGSMGPTKVATRSRRLLQTVSLELTRTLQAPEGIGNLGEHELRRQHQISSI